jgi:hypothetical protein
MSKIDWKEVRKCWGRILITVIIAIIVLLFLVIGTINYFNYMYHDCKKVGHRTMYCVMRLLR